MRVAVVGGGIVGLAVARQLVMQHPAWQVVVLEKEPDVARHQTGHNSGVIHAGIYYTPGSVKAQLCRRGAVLLKQFCTDHDIVYRNLGKLVVALDASEADRLHEIQGRAIANGVDDVVMLDRAGIARIEPHVAGVAALHSPSTAVVDFREVAREYLRDLRDRGGEIHLSTEVTSVNDSSKHVVLGTPSGEHVFDHAIICAGLHASRSARLAGADDDPRIIPFRGEYHRLRPQAAELVNGLVYPVPDPRYPFLGIHLTRRVDDTVDVGPNAVLALALEGYRRRDVSMRDLAEILAWPGFRTMARQHWRTGAREMLGSISRRRFLAQARRYLPALSLDDLLPMPAGVRAQAVRRDGSLVDDFWITTKGRTSMVRNAPSPAATSSLAIAEHIDAEVGSTLLG